MRFRGGEFSTGTTGNFQPELTQLLTLVYNLTSILKSTWLAAMI